MVGCSMFGDDDDVLDADHWDAKEGDDKERHASAIWDGVYINSASVRRDARTWVMAVS